MTDVTLKNPVTLPGGSQYAVLPLREPTLTGLAMYEGTLAETGSHTAGVMALLRAETAWPAEAIGAIRVSDMEAINEALVPFLRVGTSGKTGEASPPTLPPSSAPPSPPASA